MRYRTGHEPSRALGSCTRMVPWATWATETSHPRAPETSREIPSWAPCSHHCLLCPACRSPHPPRTRQCRHPWGRGSGRLHCHRQRRPHGGPATPPPAEKRDLGVIWPQQEGESPWERLRIFFCFWDAFFNSSQKTGNLNNPIRQDRRYPSHIQTTGISPIRGRSQCPMLSSATLWPHPKKLGLLGDKSL